MNVEDKFLGLYNLYKTDVLRLAVTYLKNMADAEDVYQLVFVKLYNQLTKFADREYSKEWLLQVTVNECKNFLKSSWKRKIFFDNDRLSEYIDSEENKDLLEILNCLPKNYRTVLYLYYYEGYKIEEIGKIINKKSSNVQTLLRRGKEKIKDSLKEDWEYER